MNTESLVTIEQIKDFLAGTEAISLETQSDQKMAYQWIQKTLIHFFYTSLKKPEKGIVIKYLVKATGYSRQQLTRLIKRYKQTGRVRSCYQDQKPNASRYTREDITLLAKLDERHQTLSGPATKKLCERAYKLFGQVEYQRLANISVSHLYNLRANQNYQRIRRNYQKTKPSVSSIGRRGKPAPDGHPGYIRIDTVHQGDLDGKKGVYHINAVDEITQFEIVCTVSQISELYLIPVIANILVAFPFKLKGFHSDNGSEYVNKQVARLLNKLLIEFTKSRPRHSNDNALAECKNGAVIRKLFGYSHIEQSWAKEVDAFHQKHTNPYVNFHRPCFFPETTVDNKGKQRKKYLYKDMMTPYEKLKSLPYAETYLRPGVSFDALDVIALSITDDEAARLLQEAKTRLFSKIDDSPMNNTLEAIEQNLSVSI